MFMYCTFLFELHGKRISREKLDFSIFFSTAARNVITKRVDWEQTAEILKENLLLVPLNLHQIDLNLSRVTIVSLVTPPPGA